MTRILGIDVSTRNTGLVLLMSGWLQASGDVDWDRVETYSIKLDSVPVKALEVVRVRRLSTFDMIFRTRLEYMRPTDVYFEQYAFGMQGANFRLTAEITGAAKLRVLRADLMPNTVNIATGRKLLLGKVPKGKGEAKAAVQRVLRDLGASWWQDDNLCDAFVVANYAASELGGCCLAVAA